MKKIRSVVSLLAVSTIMFTPVITHADPIGLYVDIYCPYTQGSDHVITNFGNYIGGYGSENIVSQNRDIYFASPSLPADMPTSLTNYYSESTAYNATSGKVSCTYTSSNPAEPRFIVSYTLTNGKGGALNWQNNNSISITLPIGRS